MGTYHCDLFLDKVYLKRHENWHEMFTRKCKHFRPDVQGTLNRFQYAKIIDFFLSYFFLYVCIEFRTTRCILVCCNYIS